jgi:hypothetical protein
LFPHHHQFGNATEGSSDGGDDDGAGVDGGTAGEGRGDGTGVLLLNEGPRGECGALCHWYCWFVSF